MPYLDKDAILNSLTKEDIIKICTEMGSPTYKENAQGELCFSTSICHGGDSPYKLVYYPNTQLFKCWTCGDAYGINVPNLTEINENILEIFWYVPYQGWLDEHISREALSRFEIGYYGLTNQITIPHRDINGRLIGIRGRYLNDYDAQMFGKYVPLFINGEFLSHQLGSNLYGLHVVKNKIKQCKKIMLVEAEKSVLQAYSYFRDDSFVVGLCGFNITFTQIKIMLKELKVEEVIVGFDRDYEEADSFEATAYYQKIIKKVAPLVPYCKVYLVLDKKNRLGYKDSPTDKGKDTLIELMKEKILITMKDVNEALGKT